MFRRDGGSQPYVMETVRRIEIPVISQVKNLLAADRYSEAVTLAFQTSVLDLQRAYQQAFPPHWTHKDVLQWTARSNLGLVTELLGRLYRLYEPVRYGQAGDIEKGDVLSPLQSLYAQSALWRLYSTSALQASYAGRYGDGYSPGGLPGLPPA